MDTKGQPHVYSLPAHIFCRLHTAWGQAADLLGKLSDATSDVKSQAGKAHAGSTFVNPPPCRHHPCVSPMPPLPTHLHQLFLPIWPAGVSMAWLAHHSAPRM
ncbi:hypothetical protein PBY51_001418 [Eleginops maclovinus]|uniref:Uncharacterized protein n=1 Tax=Eleginops maclovinus TaxID=56733 RepID=A0AAN7WZR3_ELEMC|nr:hypothetical protein PBY51_001418 [Eleginops maclovinus]